MLERKTHKFLNVSFLPLLLTEFLHKACSYCELGMAPIYSRYSQNDLTERITGGNDVDPTLALSGSMSSINITAAQVIMGCSRSSNVTKKSSFC